MAQVSNLYEQLRYLPANVLDAIATAAIRRLGLDPFVPAPLSLANERSALSLARHPLDYADEEYLALFASALGALPPSNVPEGLDYGAYYYGYSYDGRDYYFSYRDFYRMDEYRKYTSD